jgi:hypothetical protein
VDGELTFRLPIARRSACEIVRAEAVAGTAVATGSIRCHRELEDIAPSPVDATVDTSIMRFTTPIDASRSINAAHPECLQLAGEDTATVDFDRCRSKTSGLRRASGDTCNLESSRFSATCSLSRAPHGSGQWSVMKRSRRARFGEVSAHFAPTR